MIPDAAFFEKNLNTVELPEGEQSDFLEVLYSKIENQLWKSFNTIRYSSISTPIEPLDRINLFLFVLFYIGGYPAILKKWINCPTIFLLEIKISIM